MLFFESRPVSIEEISDIICVPAALICRYLIAMREAGLVIIRPVNSDGCAHLVAMTSDGIILVDEVIAASFSPSRDSSTLRSFQSEVWEVTNQN